MNTVRVGLVYPAVAIAAINLVRGARSRKAPDVHFALPALRHITISFAGHPVYTASRSRWLCFPGLDTTARCHHTELVHTSSRLSISSEIVAWPVIRNRLPAARATRARYIGGY